MFKLFYYVIAREFYLARRQLKDVFNPLLFFVLVISLFPLAINPDVKFLSTIAPGVIWVAALLATLLSLDRLFNNDYQDGSLEQWLMNPQPLPWLIFAKVFSHWLLTGLPLIIITPLLALMLHLPRAGLWPLMITLLLGTPVLSFIGSIGSALTIGQKESGILLALLVLPLYIPVLIFGAGSVLKAISGMPINGELAILGAFFCLAVTIVPFATAASLRVTLSR